MRPIFTAHTLWRAHLLLATAALGCGGCAQGAADASDSSNLGGQTGSLVPGCDPFGALQPFQVPAGDVVFAVSSPVEVTGVVDAEGTPVPVALQGSSSGVVVRTDALLAPGTYSVALHCPDGVTRSVPISVGADVAPLPTTFGTAMAPTDATPSCDNAESVTVTLELDPAVQAYASLLQVTAQFGDNPVMVAVPFGELGAERLVAIKFRRCTVVGEAECIPDGVTQLTLRGSLAGESVELPALQLVVDGSCTLGGGCAMQNAPRKRSGSVLLLLLGVLGLGALRRQRSSPDTRLVPQGEDPAAPERGI